MCLGMNPDQSNLMKDVRQPQIETLKEDKDT